jgi:hypothetical protein
MIKRDVSCHSILKTINTYFFGKRYAKRETKTLQRNSEDNSNASCCVE